MPIPFRHIHLGDQLTADAGFDCLKPGAKVRVEADSEGLFVRCAEGKHYLDEGISFNGEDYIISGFSPVLLPLEPGLAHALQWLCRHPQLGPTTVRQVAALALLATPGPHSTGSIADHLRIPRPAVSRLLNLLETEGYITNDRNLRDTRTNIIRLTEAGARVLRDLNRNLKEPSL